MDGADWRHPEGPDTDIKDRFVNTEQFGNHVCIFLCSFFFFINVFSVSLFKSCVCV